MWFSWIGLFYLNCIPYSLQLQAVSSHFYRWGNWDWIDEFTRSYTARKWCTRFCAQDPQVQSYFALDQSGDSHKVETTPVISMEKIYVTFTSYQKNGKLRKVDTSSCLLDYEGDGWSPGHHIGPWGNLKDKNHRTQNLRIKKQKEILRISNDSRVYVW